MVRPEAKREEGRYLRKHYGISISRVCRVLNLSRSTFDYRARRPERDEPVVKRLTELAGEYRRFGQPRLHVLLKREGVVVNHKRTERIYRDLGLQIKKRKRKKLGSRRSMPLKRATAPGEVWAIDFMHDYLESGRRLKILTIVDECSKVSPGILPDRSITGRDVRSFLNTLGSLPKTIRVDQGTEFTSRAFLDWAYAKGVELQFTRVRKPNQVIESFNSRLRDECLNEHVFFNLQDARSKIDDWHERYNYFNPHSSLGMRAPMELLEQKEVTLTA